VLKLLLIADFRWATTWGFAVAMANNPIQVQGLSTGALSNLQQSSLWWSVV